MRCKGIDSDAGKAKGPASFVEYCYLQPQQCTPASISAAFGRIRPYPWHSGGATMGAGPTVASVVAASATAGFSGALWVQLIRSEMRNRVTIRCFFGIYMVAQLANVPNVGNGYSANLALF